MSTRQLAREIADLNIRRNQQQYAKINADSRYVWDEILQTDNAFREAHEETKDKSHPLCGTASQVSAYSADLFLCDERSLNLIRTPQVAPHGRIHIKAAQPVCEEGTRRWPLLIPDMRNEMVLRHNTILFYQTPAFTERNVALTDLATLRLVVSIPLGQYAFTVLEDTQRVQYERYVPHLRKPVDDFAWLFAHLLLKQTKQLAERDERERNFAFRERRKIVSEVLGRLKRGPLQ